MKLWFKKIHCNRTNNVGTREGQRNIQLFIYMDVYGYISFNYYNKNQISYGTYP